MKIYAYDRPSERRINEKYPIKIGQTKRNVWARIKQQMTASDREKAECIYESHDVQFTDHKVHAILKSYGEYRIPHTEWFKTDLDTIKRAVNEAEGFAFRPDSFSMREDQQSAVDKAYNYLTINKNSMYLWNAKMRFGKTFCAYQLMKKLGAQKTLVLTYKPSTVVEWETGLNNHIDFEGYKFIRALGIKNEINLSNKSVLFASFQDILQDFIIDEESPNKENNITIKQRFVGLFKEHFDLVIIDEVHFGATNYPAQEFLENINHSATLYLSGTPFKLINRGDLFEEQVFTWTYIDEQNNKNEWLNKGFDSINPLDVDKFNPYLSLPRMTIIGYEPGKSAFKDVKYYDEDEKFNFAKFFNSKEGKTFEYQQDVNHFLDVLADKKYNTSPFFAKNVTDLNHTFWLLPNVNSVHALYHTLKNHKFFEKYNIIPASGNNLGQGADTLSLVKNAIAGFKNTITLSCGKLTTGVTIKEWNAVLLLTNTNSIETYFQSIFRAQSPNIAQDKIHYKKHCYVFDFDSNRMLRMIYDYSKEHNRTQATSNNIKEMLATMNLLCYSDNNFINLNVEDVLDMAKYGIGGAILQKKFESRNLLHADVLNNLKYDDDLMKILKDIKIFRKVANTKNEYEITSWLEKGKTFKITKESYETDKKVKDKTDETMKQVLQRLLTKLPIFMYLSEYVEERIEDVIENFESDLFEESTGITVKAFKMLKNAGAFNIENLNDAIRAFKVYERASLSMYNIIGTDILDVMANLSNEEVFTPTKIVQEVLDTLPEHVWCDKTLKWFNPAVKNGVWLREVYKRLFNGLEKAFINPKRREFHIKKHMLYGYATSNVAWMMACKTLYANIDGPEDKYIRWKGSKHISNIKNKRFLETEANNMPKFDLVIGNPPYQESDGGGKAGISAKPLYNHFIEKIKDKIDPKYFSFIIPSRWFTGGKGLDRFRIKMQKKMNIVLIKDFFNSTTVFSKSGIQIGGGVCYFLSKKNYNGICKFISNDGTIWSNDLSKHDIILREEITSFIIDKIKNSPNFIGLDKIVLPRKQFGIGTNFKDFNKHNTGIKCCSKGNKLNNLDINKFTDKFNILNKWKVLISILNAEGYNKNRLVIILKPNEISTETYIVLNTFDTENEAINFSNYVKTHFFEFLLRTKTASISFSKNKFVFVPDQQDYTKEYTDEELYKKYKLTEEEIEFIESKFK